MACLGVPPARGNQTTSTIAEEIFTGAMREAALFDDLLRKVGGDRSVVERLIKYERQKRSNATRLTCLQNAISRWEQENR